MLLWTLSQVARAHGGAVPVRGVYDFSDLPVAEPGAWIVWEFYPSIVLGCLAWLVWYALMAGPIRRKYNLAEQGPTRGEWASFVTGLAVVFWSLQGPLHELSDVYLFSGHMIQHLAITLVFPPLFIYGMPGWMTAPIIKLPGVLTVGKFFIRPVPAFLTTTCLLYLWHVPNMYDWALVNHDVHIVEHLTFMTAYVIMWWPAFSKSKLLPKYTPGNRMLYLFFSTIPLKALGAIITVNDYLMYEYYATQPRVFGLDPMVDQRIGGLIMWLPGGLIFWAVIGYIFFRDFYADIQAMRSGKGRVKNKELAALQSKTAGEGAA